MKRPSSELLFVMVEAWFTSTSRHRTESASEDFRERMWEALQAANKAGLNFYERRQKKERSNETNRV